MDVLGEPIDTLLGELGELEGEEEGEEWFPDPFETTSGGEKEDMQTWHDRHSGHKAGQKEEL